jgi:hypothetical protein
VRQSACRNVSGMCMEMWRVAWACGHEHGGLFVVARCSGGLVGTPACGRCRAASGACSPDGSLIVCRPVCLPAYKTRVCRGQGAVNVGMPDFPSIVFKWLRDTFPGANHTLVNGAVPGTPSRCGWLVAGARLSAGNKKAATVVPCMQSPSDLPAGLHAPHAPTASAALCPEPWPQV